jgi:branched-chain amino acid aminotransferase
MINEIQHNVLIKNSQLENVGGFKFPEFSEKKIIIYEVVRIINKVPLFIEDHLDRLHKSARLENCKILVSDLEIINSLKQLAKENQVENGNVKIEIHFSNGSQLLFLAYFIKHYYPSPFQYENGINVLLYSNERKNPNAKIFNLQYKKSIEAIISENMVYEVLLINKKGYITEGSKSNVFFIKENILYTAPANYVLPGITRNYVINIAEKLSVSVKEECVHIKNIDEFESAFITGTSPKVLPIEKINGKNFNVNNILLREIMVAYNHEIESYIYSRL